MSTGQVKWFNNAKGFGFILPDEGGDDLFAHYSSITMEGYKTLKAGQTVSFDVIEGPKGLHAANIVPEADDNAASAPSPAAEQAPDNQESAQADENPDANEGEDQEQNTEGTS